METNNDPAVLLDPYRHVEDDLKSRINMDVLDADKKAVQAVYPQKGVLQAMQNMFFKAVVDEMRLKGIRTYEHISEFLDIVRRRTAPFTPGEGDQQHVKGGTKRPGDSAKKQPAKSPNLAGNTGSGRKKE